jgi:hypothetical protein
MKKTLLLLFTIFTFSFASGQGNNLQFNRVVNESGGTSISSQQSFFTSGSITVPANKVLKITSGSVFSIYPNNYTDYRVSLKIGDHILIRRSTVNGTERQFNGNYPVWLSSGTYTVFVEHPSGGYNGVSYEAKWSISGVEFNIVQ